MKYYVGIDLGTTNSAISTFDGENVRVWKSKKDQNDVTPSAIYIDKRGKRFYGKTAYLKAAQQPDRCAVLFKRYMGTNTLLTVGDEKMSPEECSAEILKELYKNLPEEIWESDEKATVITVPAAFNQMQNAATKEAAQKAGLGKVALMQEPVAAIMSVMLVNSKDANFVIYDLGGGTLDVAIAESIGGKVNLLAHNGIAMCGGRDFDRILMEKIVIPWLQENYDLPSHTEMQQSNKYKKLLRIASYKTEIAKIELSTDETSSVDGETGVTDESGEEIYLDIVIEREQFNQLIHDMVMQSIKATKETIEKSGLTKSDIDRIVFIGGPTNYKPLRDKVCEETGIQGSIEVNPMTAVSEGAAIFAESIDWSSEEHGRKATRKKVESADALGLSFKYVSRTTENQARVAVSLTKSATGYTFEIKSDDTGWTSGLVDLKDKAKVIVPLEKRGDNHFSVEVFDNYGRSIPLQESHIIISYTMATVGAILASHSIGVEVRESSTSTRSTLDYLVREGDTLPAKGTKVFRAAETIRAGSPASLNFKLWEGEIEDEVEDNRFIGCIKVSGEDFSYGMIPAGAEIECSFVVNDSGSIDIELNIDSISQSFNSNKNFYSRQEGQVDLDHIANKINADGKNILAKVRGLSSQLDQPYEELNECGEIASRAICVRQETSDRESLQHLSDDILHAKRILNRIKRENLQKIREKNLEQLIEYYHDTTEKYSDEEDRERYEKLFANARLVMGENSSAFDNMLQSVRYLNFDVLYKNNPEFPIRWFMYKIQNPENYSNQEQFYQLAEIGKKAIEQNDISTVKQVIGELARIEIADDEPDVMTNITKG